MKQLGLAASYNRELQPPVSVKYSIHDVGCEINYCSLPARWVTWV